MALLNIDSIVNVSVSMTESNEVGSGFNVGLIVGSSGRIAASKRIKEYTSVDKMAEDGFLVTDPEYMAAALYFAQNPAPKSVYVGAMDVSEGSTETLQTAVEACYAINNDWYGLYVCDAPDEVIKGIAAWTVGKRVCYFLDDNDDKIIEDAETDIFSVIGKISNIKGVFAQYTTAQYGGAAAMGRAMGLNDGSADSAFTMAYKDLSGIDTEDLTLNQVAILKKKNVNVYISRASSYKVLEQGVCINGTPFDEVLGLDQFAGSIQTNVMNLLTAKATRKIPYTNDGAARIVSVINDACAAAKKRGFLAAGVWEGSDILDLKNGDALSEGYMVQSELVEDQSAANRAGRIAPPIYVAAKLSGAVEFATIAVNVMR